MLEFLLGVLLILITILVVLIIVLYIMKKFQKCCFKNNSGYIKQIQNSPGIFYLKIPKLKTKTINSEIAGTSNTADTGYIDIMGCSEYENNVREEDITERDTERNMATSNIYESMIISNTASYVNIPHTYTQDENIKPHVDLSLQLSPSLLASSNTESFISVDDHIYEIMKPIPLPRTKK
jgi:hypothetical protein